MAVQIPSDKLINPQSLEAVVSGPDGANRLFVFTGAAPVSLVVQRGSLKETFTWLLGPQLTRRQFVQAVADASISHFGMGPLGPGTAPGQWDFLIELAEADWDDESRQVECRVEVRINNPTSPTPLNISRLNYHVTMLAEISAPPS